MKKILRWVGLVVGVVVLLLGGVLAYVALAPIPSYAVQKVDFPVDVTPERVARGKKYAQMLCAGCHLDSGTGALTGKRMPDLPAQFGESWSRNITGHPDKGVGSWTDGEIAYLLRTGVSRDGRYTPPWMIKMPNSSDEDIRDIIAFLRSDDPLVRSRDVDDRDSRPSFLTKLLCRVAFKPFPYPSRPIVAPPPEDRIAHGRYIVNAQLQCFGCHSKDFKTVDDMNPEKSVGYLGGGNPMPDMGGKIVHTANLTPDPETGIGNWTEAQFRRALVDGVGPDNQPVRYPMEPLRLLTEGEVSAIFAYLRSVPPIRNKVPSPEPYAIPVAERGKQAYYQYGCNTCHGDAGVGLHDLRKGPAKYPTDAELIAYIKHPEKAIPGTQMPTWDGVIADDDYAPLAAYVRTLGSSGG